MATRLVNMTLWQRDWYLGLEGKYQLFVHYLRDHCDHAGVWQPSFVLFEKMTGFRINPQDFLTAVNAETIRVLLLDNGRWWLTGFIEDQYKTKEMKDTVNPHKGVINSIRFNEIPYKSYGYELTLTKGSEGVKDKDKDKDKSIDCIDSEEGMQGEKPKPAKTKFVVPDYLKDVWPAFEEMRKGIRKPLTDKAKQLTIKELDKLSNNEAEKIAIIEQSIQRCWQGVFALNKPKTQIQGDYNADGVKNIARPGEYPEYLKAKILKFDD